MTALQEYERLEAQGLWRAALNQQRRDVIVSIGEATLLIADTRDQVLAHWSLAAVARANPGQFPAIFHPDGDPSEILELSKDEDQMIGAIEKLRGAIERRRPHPGRVRLVTALGSAALVAAVAILWLPDAVRRHTESVVPAVKRAEIGAALLGHIQRVAGLPCDDAEGRRSLSRLNARVGGTEGGAERGSLRVMRSGVRDTVALPGGIVLIDRSLVEIPEEPDVVAGYVLVERLRSEIRNPLARLLDETPVTASFKLLTTGRLPDKVLAAYAERLLTTPAEALPNERVLEAFRAAELRSSPYAYAVDITGEATLALIEADPWATGVPRPVLADADWVRLQGICGS